MNMNRNFVNDQFSNEKRSFFAGKIKRWMLLSIMLLLFVAGFFFWHQHVKRYNFSVITNYYRGMAHWVFASKHPVNKPIEIKPTVPYVTPINENEISFEFYKSEDKNNVAATPEPIIKAQEYFSDLVVLEKKPTAVIAKKSMLNPKELEQELSSQLKSKQYIIQLGAFSRATEANQLQNKLNHSGFSVVVIKVKEGKRELYRVQQGPFTSLAQAKSSQKILQKKGITSQVRVLEKA